jgi:hypothetical protein
VGSMKSIPLTVDQWTKIRKQIKQEYPMRPSILIIRDTMKRELGFTTRYHSEWVEDLQMIKETIYLDFYDNQLETLFRLKYL